MNTHPLTGSTAISQFTVPSNAKSFTSGKDKTRLAKGDNYFICGIGKHCAGGIKLA